MSTMSAESHRARRAIFDRLRQAAPLAAHDGDAAEVRIDRWDDATVGDSGRTARFIERARAWQAEVIESTPDTWIHRLVEAAAERGLRRLYAGRDTAIAEVLGDSAIGSRLEWFDQPIEACKQALFTTAEAGITTATGGVAQTGSLLLCPSAAEPRALSLIPPVHIAVVRESTLHDTLLDAMRDQRWADDMPSNMLMVTGPSKTADIQRMLVYGVHGPRALVIVLIRDLSENVA